MAYDSRLPKVLIISHDKVGTYMAGPGIRAWEMARALSRHQSVTLISPHRIDTVMVDSPEDAETGPTRWFETGSYTWGDSASLGMWVRDADVVVANAFVLQAHQELRTITQPLALDLYDPTLLENLELFRKTPYERREKQYQQDMALLQQQLAAGDFFLCATERQRDLYIGALMVQGRLTPSLTDQDHSLHRLIAVVPFGLPSEPPKKQLPLFRGILPNVGDDDPILLWTGGLWDWMDPVTLVNAMPTIVEHHPTARLIFLAGKHPGSDHPMRAPQEAKARAEAIGLLDTNIFFHEEWLAYHRRGDALLEATIAISLHRNHLETHYAAVRSRILDHLWAGLPSVVSGGDPASLLLQGEGPGSGKEAGVVVPPEAVESVAEAVVSLLSDEERRQSCSAAARELATSMTWEHVLEPLATFCHSPWQTRPSLTSLMEQSEEQEAELDEDTSDEVSMGGADDPLPLDEEQALEECRNAAIAVQEQTWRLQEPQPAGRFARIRQFLIDQIVRPFVVPLIEQQQSYNTAVLRSLYAINQMGDQRYTATNKRHQALSDTLLEEILNRIQLLERVKRLSGRVDQLRENSRMTQEQLADFAEQLAGLEEADSQLLQLLYERAADLPTTEANAKTGAEVSNRKPSDEQGT